VSLPRFTAWRQARAPERISTAFDIEWPLYFSWYSGRRSFQLAACFAQPMPISTSARGTSESMESAAIAAAVAEALGIDGVQPVREISQGVVVSRTRVGERNLCLVTKAGGFGPIEVLVRIREDPGRES
jgi:hypothetical protein